jgi:hypothetical protein
MPSRSRADRSSTLAVLLVTLLAALLAACSSSDDVASPDTTAAAPDTTEAAAPGPPSATTPRPPCAANTLGAAALANFEAPALIDVVCQQQHATATLTNGPGGELLLLFQVADGAWVLVGSGPVDDLAAVATPADFSTTAIPEWARARQARLTRAAAGPSAPAPSPDAPPSSLYSDPGTGEQMICTEPDLDVRVCTPSTTAPPPPDPENPDAPPPDVPESMFCKYNYNDPRCVADPGFSP